VGQRTEVSVTNLPSRRQGLEKPACLAGLEEAFEIGIVGTLAVQKRLIKAREGVSLIPNLRQRQKMAQKQNYNTRYHWLRESQLA